MLTSKAAAKNSDVLEENRMEKREDSKASTRETGRALFLLKSARHETFSSLGMRASLSLQISLYRRQRRQISAAFASSSRHFRRYEARYRNATRRFSRQLEPGQLNDAVAEADIVYVGDYHTLKLAQDGYLDLVKAALASGRRVVLALELVEGRFQSVVDHFLKGAIKERTFLTRIGHPYKSSFDIWPHFAPIFSLAARRGLDVVAIDSRSSSPRSLEVRDRYAAARIAAAAAADDRPLVMVLMGQFHVAPSHLPAQVKTLLKGVDRRHLVVYQNAEGVYWQLAKAGLADRVSAVELRPGELCVVSTSPVECQQSFLDYVEAEQHDAPLEKQAAAATFQKLARVIADFVGVDVEQALEDVEVLAAGDVDRFDHFAERGRFSAKELKALRRHVLSLESAYIPRARMAYLATLSINHAAEEAAHFVRHAAVGDAMVRPRVRSDAFFARCLEEALGFFGSRLINPARRVAQLDEWVTQFQSGKGLQKRAAAFVLALKAAEADGPAAMKRLVPADDKVFNAASHALGYLLGEALFRAVDSGRLPPSFVRSACHDAFEAPVHAYFAFQRMTVAAETEKRGYFTAASQ